MLHRDDKGHEGRTGLVSAEKKEVKPDDIIPLNEKELTDF
jgi:hypothetical protein